MKDGKNNSRQGDNFQFYLEKGQRLKGRTKIRKNRRDRDG